VAKDVQYAEITLRFVTGTPPNEALDYDSGNMRYSVCDSADNEMAKGVSNVKVDTIVGTDTVDAWIAKVAQQIKDAEGIS